MNQESTDNGPDGVFALLATLNDEEMQRLSPAAARSTDGRRRRPEERIGYRQQFAQDADRILHSRAYTRYIDKTQVFCLISNDHITHRVLHVQLVSRIARTVGRFLRLNEDLIEAIALGHDIGHPPFGHAGEHVLATLCRQHGLPPFQHNIQSVRALDRLERKGRGWNLTLQTLDGILCHDGEIHATRLTPEPLSDFAAFDAKLSAKAMQPELNLLPMTLEACVVRMADTVAYIGRDIEDAIVLKIIDRDDIPSRCQQVLGRTNGSIVYSLVTDLIEHSRVTRPGIPADPMADSIGFSAPVAEALAELKRFNYQRIYLNVQTKKHLPMIEHCYRTLFTTYLNHLDQGTEHLLGVDLMGDLGEEYTRRQPSAARIRDFIAGMTDDYFLTQAAAIGCPIPPRS